MVHLQPPVGSTESGDPITRPPQDGGPSAAPGPSASRWNWVPVRSLTARHRERFFTHLMALGEHDRYLRFGYPATDAQIGKYVDTLDFDRDEVFGIFNRKLALIAAAHLAYSPAPQRSDHPAMAEFGVSVIPAARGRRFGSRLFDHAILHARNRGVGTLFIHALSENTAMLRITRAAGAKVVRDGSESEAWLELPPETIGSRFDEVLGHNAAEFDYQFKRQANRVNSLLEAIAEVKKKLGSSAHAASE